MIVPVILAGGTGTRLWPLSRALYPKQLMNLVDENTMLQSTVSRLKEYTGIGGPIILCNEDHRFMVAEQLRMIRVKPSAIILEPVGRNTAPALAIASLKAMAAGDDPILLVLPADHFIEDIKQFHNTLQTGERYAQMGKMITFGIVPDAPETGYGYIRKGEKLSVEGKKEKQILLDGFAIEKFVEKPDETTAKKYVDSGDYCWNSGMFMFKASQVLKELKKFTPEIFEACDKAFENGNEDLDFFRLDAEAFKVCPSDSIDYAVMEKTDNGAMVPLQAGWNDLGSWEALWQVGEKDEDNNVVSGDILSHDVKRSYLNATSRMIAAVGLEDHIVVETPDAVLISPRDRVQDVKKLVDKLKKYHREEALSHKTDYRPWGTSESIVSTERFMVNRIVVNPNAKLSLQKHHYRSEHWIVVKGEALVTKADEQFILNEDQSTYIPIEVAHRLENPGKLPLEIIEVQTGSSLGNNDIIRLEDAYGR